MSGLRADITYIERQIENLSREIDESMQFLGLQENVSGTSMPRRVTRTSTPFTGRSDRALGNVSHRDVSGMADKSTQTAGYRKRVKEVTITKYHENGRSVENIVEREEFYNM